MIVKDEEKENKKVSTHSQSASHTKSTFGHPYCMVVKGAITQSNSHHLAVGMEHEKPLAPMVYGGVLQTSTSNGISELVDASPMSDDEAEIEAAAAQSETPLPNVVKNSFKPLHVQTNNFNGSGSETSTVSGPRSSLSTSSSVPSASHLKRPPIPSPMIRRDYQSQRVSTSNVPNIIMGPPSQSSSVLLSPAGNINNGFSRSGETPPLSPATGHLQRAPSKRDQYAHPLAHTQHLGRPPIPNRPPNYVPNLVTHVSNPNTQRKDIELNKRRIMADKLQKYRDDGSVSVFLPQIDSHTATQMAMYLRRNRMECLRDMPAEIRSEVFDEKMEDASSSTIVAKKLKTSMVMRTRDNEPDDVTDISEGEDDEESLAERVCRNTLGPTKVPLERLKWNENKMRIGNLNACLRQMTNDRYGLFKSLQDQLQAIDLSSGVRFGTEDVVPKKRQKIDGEFHVSNDEKLVRSNAEDYGCSRCMPMVSWTRRKLHRNVFSRRPDDHVFDPNVPSCSTSFDKLPKYDNQIMPISSERVVTNFTFGNKQKRTYEEYTYQSYEEGKGIVEIRNIPMENAVNYVCKVNYLPLEQRILKFSLWMSLTPLMVSRRTLDRSVFLDPGIDEKNRNGAHRLMAIREKRDNRDRKRERKEESSDDEDWSKTVRIGDGKKRGRGRPAKAPKKITINQRTIGTRSATGTRSNFRADIGFDDYFMDEPLNIPLPPKIAYARIHVPTWVYISEDFWKEDEDNTADHSPSPAITDEELWCSVAKDHHKLVFLERERVKRDAKKHKHSNKLAPLKAPGSSTPHPSTEEVVDEDALLQLLPPFDVKEYEPNQLSRDRRFESIEQPYEKRDFFTK